MDKTTTDADLLSRIAAGDRAAAGAFVARHQSSLFRFCRAICRNPSTAEDVLQDTFIAAIRGASGFAGEASARAWLLAIARRTCIRHGRLRAGEPQDAESLSELGQRAGWGCEESPESIAELGESRELLVRAMERLPVEYQEIIVLRELEELSGEETAKLLGLTTAAAKSRLHRARLLLTAIVREEFHGA